MDKFKEFLADTTAGKVVLVLAGVLMIPFAGLLMNDELREKMADDREAFHRRIADATNPPSLI